MEKQRGREMEIPANIPVGGWIDGQMTKRKPTELGDWLTGELINVRMDRKMDGQIQKERHLIF